MKFRSSAISTTLSMAFLAGTFFLVTSCQDVEKSKATEALPRAVEGIDTVSRNTENTLLREVKEKIPGHINTQLVLETLLSHLPEGFELNSFKLEEDKVICKVTPPDSQGHHDNELYKTFKEVDLFGADVQVVQNSKDLTLELQVSESQIVKREFDVESVKKSFHSYTKSGSPRGQIQQKLKNLAKTCGLDDMRVRIELERDLPESKHLKKIDFSISTRHFSLESLLKFLDTVNSSSMKAYINGFKYYKSGKSFTMSASLRFYVLNFKTNSSYLKNEELQKAAAASKNPLLFEVNKMLPGHINTQLVLETLLSHLPEGFELNYFQFRGHKLTCKITPPNSQENHTNELYKTFKEVALFGADTQVQQGSKDLTLELQVSESQIVKREFDVESVKKSFHSYTKTGSPRGQIRQKLKSLAKTYGLDDMRVSIGFERTVPGFEYLKRIDFSTSTRKISLQDLDRIHKFFKAVNSSSQKAYVTEIRIFKSGKSFAMSANLRFYILNRKASVAAIPAEVKEL